MNTQINSSEFVRVGDEICTVNRVFSSLKYSIMKYSSQNIFVF